MAANDAKLRKLTQDYLKKIAELNAQYKKDISALVNKITERKINDVRKKLL